MQLVCCISRIPVFCQLTALELNAVIAFVLPEEWANVVRILSFEC